MSNLFLRHGEVQNEKDVFYANLPGFYLSSKGEMQAKNAGIKIKEQFDIKNIISSPLSVSYTHLTLPTICSV